jgi:uncharacterized integral membrane protein
MERSLDAVRWIRMMAAARLVIAVAVAAYLTLFVFKNTYEVQMVLPFIAQGELPSWLICVLSAAMGACVTSLALSFPILRRGAQVRRDTKKIAKLEQELHGLRTLPLASPKPEPLQVSSSLGE